MTAHAFPAYDRPVHDRTRVPAPTVAAAQTRPSDRSGPGKLRLTRRGRIVVVLVTLMVVCLGFTLGRASAGTATGGAVHTVTVHPGDTLWSLASRTAPDRDPRLVVAKIQSLNGLHNSEVRTGQVLRLPS